MTETPHAVWQQLTRSQQVLLYVLVHIDELKARGLLVGGRLTATEQSRQACAQMQAAGFVATLEEIHQAIADIQSYRPPAEATQ